MEDEGQEQPVCRGGSAVTVWGLEVGVLPVYYFRMEGNPLTPEEREHVLDFYRSTIAAEEAFATLYDLTRGLTNFAEHVVPFSSFCNSMRSVTEGRLQFTVAVCPNSLYRGFLSIILRMAPSHAPFYVVTTLDEAWDVLARSGDGTEEWDPCSNEAQLESHNLPVSL